MHIGTHARTHAHTQVRTHRVAPQERQFFRALVHLGQNVLCCLERTNLAARSQYLGNKHHKHHKQSRKTTTSNPTKRAGQYNAEHRAAGYKDRHVNVHTTHVKRSYLAHGTDDALTDTATTTTTTILWRTPRATLPHTHTYPTDKGTHRSVGSDRRVQRFQAPVFRVSGLGFPPLVTIVVVVDSRWWLVVSIVHDLLPFPQQCDCRAPLLVVHCNRRNTGSEGSSVWNKRLVIVRRRHRGRSKRGGPKFPGTYVVSCLDAYPDKIGVPATKKRATNNSRKRVSIGEHLMCVSW